MAKHRANSAVSDASRPVLGGASGAMSTLLPSGERNEVVAVAAALSCVGTVAPPPLCPASTTTAMAQGRPLRENDDMSDLVQVMGQLVRDDEHEAATALFDAHLVRLLADQELDTIRAAVEVLPPVARSITARLALAEERVLRRTSTLSELQALEREVARLRHTVEDRGGVGSGNPSVQHVDTLWWWSRVLVAEHLLAQFDLPGALDTARVVDEIPLDVVLPELALYVRARLRLVAAIGWLVRSPADVTKARAELAAATADLNRCGFFAARSVAVTTFFFFHVSVTGEVGAEAHFALTEARDQLEALGSPQLPFAQLVLGLVTYSRGELEGADAALAKAESSSVGNCPFVSLLATHTRLLIELHRTGNNTVLARVDDVLIALRGAMPAGIAAPLLRTAQAALDAGLVDDGAEYVGRLGGAPVLLPGYEASEREIQLCRIELVRGERSVVSRLEAVLDGLRSAGLLKAAAWGGLRAAADAQRAGLDDLSGVLRARAAEDALNAGGQRLDELPRGRREATVDQSVVGGEPTSGSRGDVGGDPIVLTPLRPLAVPWLADPSSVSAEPSPIACGPSPRSVDHLGCPDLLQRRRITLLAPVLTVVSSVVRTVPLNSARLLAALAVRPAPIAVETLCAHLWPDASEDLSRRRLKTALYRLRSHLGIGVDELVVRRRDTISLALGEAWSVDLHDFWRLASGSADERLLAWRMVDGLVCHAQLPYEELLCDERHAVLARWERLTSELRASSRLSGDEVEDRARHLGLSADTWSRHG